MTVFRLPLTSTRFPFPRPAVIRHLSAAMLPSVMLFSAARRSEASSFSRRLRARLLEHRIKGVPELVAQMRPATHEETGDHASSVDDDGLRNGIGRVLLGNGPITVECDRRVQLVPLEHGGDLPGRFLQVDRDQLYVPISKLAGDPLDLRHRLQARSTPG